LDFPFGLDSPFCGSDFLSAGVLGVPSAQQGYNAVQNGYRDDDDADEWSICVFHMTNFWKGDLFGKRIGRGR
jgi:hypothetical protein